MHVPPPAETRFLSLKSVFLNNEVSPITELADDYYFGRGTDVNKEIAYALYQKASTDFFIAAAGKEYPLAESRLASACHHGTGIPKDDGKAACWACQAMDAGEPAGATLLAKLYAAGESVPRDPARAHEQRPFLISSKPPRTPWGTSLTGHYPTTPRTGDDGGGRALRNRTPTHTTETTRSTQEGITR